MLYANLAVRGRRVSDVLENQLPQALALKPDLVTVCIGMNDATRPGDGFEQALLGLDEIYRQLAEHGATVVTTTFPDVVKVVPTGRFIATRILRINAAVTAASEKYGFALIDLYTAPSMIEPGTWSSDRMHASARGHTLFAEAAAEALGLPGSNGDWRSSSALRSGCPDAADATSIDTIYNQVQWAGTLFVPWLWNHFRGRSSGDGRAPKYASLIPASQLSIPGSEASRRACTDSQNRVPSSQ